MGLLEMKNMLQQARSMQSEMKKKQKELSRQTFEGSAGNGAVVAKFNGKLELLGLSLAPELASSGDARRLEDLIRLAVNDGLKQSQAAMQQSLSGLMGNAGGMGNLLNMLK